MTDIQYRTCQHGNMLGSWSRVGWGHLSGGDLDFGAGNFRIGAEIFGEASPFASRIYLTIVQVEIEGDTYMPEWNSGEWREPRVQPTVPLRSVPE